MIKELVFYIQLSMVLTTAGYFRECSKNECGENGLETYKNEFSDSEWERI